MKQCPVCGLTIPPEVPFCPQCGTSMLVLSADRLLTGSKPLDVLTGAGISLALLLTLGSLCFLLASLFSSFGAGVIVLLSLPAVATLLAAWFAYRRCRFVAYGMLIPLLLGLLLGLGLLALCGGFH